MPSPDHSGEITRFLREHADGDDEALGRLIPLVYEELRRIAHERLRGRPASSSTLSTTVLVNEAYLRLANDGHPAYADRDHFMAVCSKIIRNIMVDHSRRRSSARRGGDIVRIPLRVDRHAAPESGVDILALDEALTALARHDARLERVVECRFFGGLSVDETARTLGISKRTCERDWTRARAYLYRALAADA